MKFLNVCFQFTFGCDAAGSDSFSGEDDGSLDSTL